MAQRISQAVQFLPRSIQEELQYGVISGNSNIYIKCILELNKVLIRDEDQGRLNHMTITGYMNTNQQLRTLLKEYGRSGELL